MEIGESIINSLFNYLGQKKANFSHNLVLQISFDCVHWKTVTSSAAPWKHAVNKNNLFVFPWLRCALPHSPVYNIHKDNYLGQNSLFLTFLSHILARHTRPSPTHCKKVMSSSAPAQLGETASLKFLAQTSAGKVYPLQPSDDAMDGYLTQNSKGNLFPK